MIVHNLSLWLCIYWLIYVTIGLLMYSSLWYIKIYTNSGYSSSASLFLPMTCMILQYYFLQRLNNFYSNYVWKKLCKYPNFSPSKLTSIRWGVGISNLETKRYPTGWKQLRVRVRCIRPDSLNRFVSSRLIPTCSQTHHDGSRIWSRPLGLLSLFMCSQRSSASQSDHNISFVPECETCGLAKIII